MKMELIDGCFAYPGGKPILQDVSFTAQSGEIVAILGPNGVGKTTLVRCLLGFNTFTSGTVKIDGKEEKKRGRDFWRRVAYVPQARNHTFSYSCLETVLMGRGPYLSLFEQPKKEDEQIARKAMKQAGVLHLADKNSSEISGGELQLVLIARALVSDPELLIMDEPETGLDFRNQLTVLNMIVKLSRENGKTVLLNTHYPDHALEISDKALLLEKGGHSRFGCSRDMITESNLREAFDVDVRIRSEQIGGRQYSSVIPIEVLEETAG